LLSACSSVPKELETLDDMMNMYERALRWQNYDGVISLHKNDRGKMTPEKRRYLKRFRVTSYDEVYRKLGANNKSATQVIEVKYYNDDYAVIKGLTLRNQWEYDDKTKRWQLDNPFPNFK